MDFKQVPKKYRPIPFWSWNEKLEPSETKRQAKEMARIGMGGFFMHARGGLETEYMSDEWFDNVEAATAQSEDDGTKAWAYDENGWPSGFGNGMVNGLGVEYQQKYLRFEDGEKQTDTTIINKDGVHFYYEINPFYVDTLDSKVTDKFIELIYEPYYKKFKNRITGFFTDEPQISRNGLPWSFIMPETYKERYGDNLLDKLIELFKPVGDYKRTRIRYWKMVTDLFSNNFMKPIYDWCDEHKLKLQGIWCVRKAWVHSLRQTVLVCRITNIFIFPVLISSTVKSMIGLPLFRWEAPHISSEKNRRLPRALRFADIM